MTRKALIVLVGIALLCKPGCLFTHVNSAAAPVSALADDAAAPAFHTPVPLVLNIKSVFGEMFRDNEVCSDSKLLYGSKFTKRCNEVNYPTNNITLNQQNVQQFLCIGIYDRTMKLCHLNSLSGIEGSFLPVNASSFDAEIEKLFPKDQKQDIDYCEEWKTSYSAGYLKINHYVTQLEEVLKQPVKCIKMCTDANDQFTDLCTVLVFMDKLTEQYKLRLDALKQTKQEQEIKGHNMSGGAVNAGEQTNSKMTSKLEKVKQSAQTPEKTGSKSQHPSAVSANVKPVMEQIKETPAKSQIQEPSPQDDKQPAEPPIPYVPSAAAKSSQIQSQIPAQEKKNTNNGQPDVLQKSELPSKPNLSSADLNPKTNDQAPVGDIASETEDGTHKQNVPVGEPYEALNLDHQLDNNANSDVISQNTQDHDSEEGADIRVNSNNEIDRPKTLQEEDAVQSPPEPLDPRDYVHPIPNIRNDDDSHFFSYFTIIGVMCVAGYIGYNYKQKILAMVLEGRRSRGSRGRRRPSTVNYRKLDCTLEEAVTSQCNSNVTHVIY